MGGGGQRSNKGDGRAGSLSKVTQTAVIRPGGETEARTGKLLTVTI